MIILDRFCLSICIGFCVIQMYGCSGFSQISRRISTSYTSSEFYGIDRKNHHQVRMFAYHQKLFDKKDYLEDTIIFIQSHNIHTGKTKLSIIRHGICEDYILSPGPYFVKQESSSYPAEFITAISNWDIDYFNKLKEDHTFHQVSLYISKIARKNIYVLLPKPYFFQ